MRDRWLPEGGLRERTALKPKSVRFDWHDGATRVNVFFTPKGEARSTAAIQHERLPDAEEAERMRAYWRERVAVLKEVLEHERTPRGPEAGAGRPPVQCSPWVRSSTATVIARISASSCSGSISTP